MRWREFESLVRCAIPDKEVAENADIMPYTRLIEDLEYDSFAVVDLLSIIERDYGIDYMKLDHFEERFGVCGDLYDGMRELMAARKLKSEGEA